MRIVTDSKDRSENSYVSCRRRLGSTPPDERNKISLSVNTTPAEIAASDDPDEAWEYVLYLRGDSSDDESESWLRAGAEHGIMSAMEDYASFLEDAGDWDAAEHWYGAAAALGSAPALHEMAFIHAERGEWADAKRCLQRVAAFGWTSELRDLAAIIRRRGR